MRLGSGLGAERTESEAVLVSHGAMAAIWVAFVCSLFVGVIFVTSDSKLAEAFRAWLTKRVDLGWAATAGRWAGLSRAVHLQQARLTHDPFGLSPADLAGTDHLDGSWLRKMARSQVAELGAALSAPQDDPDNPGRYRALACYDAAALLAAERTGQLDLIGAIVLAREGRTALADRDPLPLPVCQVHPLHGPAYRLPPRGRPPRARRRLAAVCAGCRTCPAWAADRWALLTDGVPIYRTDGFWAQVGFGAFDPQLPTRVLEYLGVE